MAGSGAGSGERDAKPGPTEERTTERRMVTASAVMHTAAEAPRQADAANEDFLFHLYRGSELLQDNRIHEAKEELEHALTLQPRDPKGQDLLAVVYFRIGLYPRAIQIFEQLKRDNPREPSIKLNLALSYLKTGQAQAARGELEDVVRLHPSHKRAWGYLGLAYERTGELEKARAAFERGGHAQMAQRLGDQHPPPPSVGRGGGGAAEAEVRGVVATAFEELDAGEISFSLAESVTGSTTTGPWRAIEPGAAPPSRGASSVAVAPAGGGWTVPPSAEAVASVHAEVAVSRDQPTPFPSPPAMPGAHGLPTPLAHLTRGLRLVFPPVAGVTLHPSGVALVRARAGDDPRPFAGRLEAVRLQTGDLTADVLPRQAHGKSTSESFGGVASPLVRLAGVGELVLGPRPSHRLLAFAIAEESIALREDILLGFELAPIAYESDKLATGDGETVHVVHLRGTGVVLIEILEHLQTIEVADEHPALVRRDTLLGWTGSIAPRAVTPAEAPSGQRGLIRLAGAGTALLSSS